MILSFDKYEGAGNDFLIVEKSALPLDFSVKEQVPRLCDRRRGIGADGLLVFSFSSDTQVQLEIYNADGSRPEMCGNGLRCILAHLCKEELLTIYTDFGVFVGGKRNALYFYEQSLPENPREEHLEIAGEEIQGYYIDTGVPHFVTFVPNLEKIIVSSLGRAISLHPRFAPRGTNVTFASQQLPISARFFERGVGETPACGTGVVAAAYTAHLHRKFPSNIVVNTSGEDAFAVAIDEEKISVAGPAHHVFSGEISLQQTSLCGC